MAAHLHGSTARRAFWVPSVNCLLQGLVHLMQGCVVHCNQAFSMQKLLPLHILLL